MDRCGRGVSATEFVYGLAVSAVGVTKHQYQLFVLSAGRDPERQTPLTLSSHIVAAAIHIDPSSTYRLLLRSVFFTVYQSKIMRAGHTLIVYVFCIVVMFRSYFIRSCDNLGGPI